MKNWIILILAATCIALWFVPRGVKKDDGTVEPDVKQLVDTEVKRVNKRIDEKGFEHAVIAEVENTINTDTKLSDSVRAELDSVLILLDVKENQLKHYIRYSTTLQDSLLKANQIINDKGDTVFNYSDKWANITYVPNITGGHFNFKYNAEINYAEYWKRDWFLGKKKYYVDFWLSDKRATINGVSRIKFEPTPPKTKFQVNAVASYYNGGLHSGVDGQVRIGSRYWLGGGYIYDFNKEKWNPIFTTRFSVIDWE